MCHFQFLSQCTHIFTSRQLLACNDPNSSLSTSHCNDPTYQMFGSSGFDDDDDQQLLDLLAMELSGPR